MNTFLSYKINFFLTYFHFHPLTMLFLYYVYLNLFLILIIITVCMIIKIRLSLKLICIKIISGLIIFVLYFSLLLFDNLLNLSIVSSFLEIKLWIILFDQLVKHVILNRWEWPDIILIIILPIRLYHSVILLIILFFIILLVILRLFIFEIIINSFFHVYLLWSFIISLILPLF